MDSDCNVHLTYQLRLCTIQDAVPTCGSDGHVETAESTSAVPKTHFRITVSCATVCTASGSTLRVTSVEDKHVMQVSSTSNFFLSFFFGVCYSQ